MSELSIEHELLDNVIALDLEVVDTVIEDLGDATRVRIVMQDDPDVLGSCAWGLIYALGALSFADGRPQGDSDLDYVARDTWKAEDMIRHLRFERGGLHFYADHVRGRMLKTTVEIDGAGRITLETVNRGEAATRWVAKLQGKRVIRLVED